MARPLRIEFEGAVYHVTSRGNARERIFLVDRDHERFLQRLGESVATYDVRLYLFCLMPNHFHLVLETPRGNLGRFMQSLLTGYAVYFNLKHERVGHLTQGRYNARLVETEGYLLRLSRYVHLNPGATGASAADPAVEQAERLRAYPWSSYRSYIGLATRLPFVEYEPVLAQMGGPAADRVRRYREFVEGGLARTDEEFHEILRASPRSIGGEAFRQWVDDRHARLLGPHERKEDVAFRRPPHRVPPEHVIAAVCRELQVPPDAVRRRQRGGMTRPVAAHMLTRHAGVTQRDAAAALGLGSGAAVSAQLLRLRAALAADNALRQAVARIEACLADASTTGCRAGSATL